MSMKIWKSRKKTISLQYQRTFGKNFNSKRRWYLQLIHMPKKKMNTTFLIFFSICLTFSEVHYIYNKR